MFFCRTSYHLLSSCWFTPSFVRQSVHCAHIRTRTRSHSIATESISLRRQSTKVIKIKRTDNKCHALAITIMYTCVYTHLHHVTFMLNNRVIHAPAVCTAYICSALLTAHSYMSMRICLNVKNKMKSRSSCRPWNFDQKYRLRTQQTFEIWIRCLHKNNRSNNF